jgi:hypothetical protein
MVDQWLQAVVAVALVKQVNITQAVAVEMAHHGMIMAHTLAVVVAVVDFLILRVDLVAVALAV